MAEDRVTVTMRDGVADVRLNRPEKLNALDPAMMDALIAVIDRLAIEPGLRAVVLSGEGRGFCAGLDMASMAAMGGDLDLSARTSGIANRFQQMAWGWRTLPVPVIAAAHGMALGGGLQILSGADIRICAPQTRFSILEMKWGIVPDMGGFALWRGPIRDDVLRELIYTAREFDTAEASGWGFASHVSDDPHGDALALAREIAGRSPHAVRAAKRLANAMHDADAPAILMAESREQAALIGSPNQIEAVSAGLARRSPTFTD